MLMRQDEASRRAKLTTVAISGEAKENSQHMAASASAAYDQAVADRSTAGLNLERTVVRAPMNGYVTNLTLVVGQYAAIGTGVMALIDSDSYRIDGYFEETKLPVIRPGARVDIHLMSGEPLCTAMSTASAMASRFATIPTVRSFWQTSIRPSNGFASRNAFPSVSRSTRFPRTSASAPA
jgi:multidrug resistance efflux pump